MEKETVAVKYGSNPPQVGLRSEGQLRFAMIKHRLKLSFFCCVMFWILRNMVLETSRTLSASTGDQRYLFDWSKVIPSKSLHWYSCYLKFECSRFEVPLDYTEPDGQKVAIALVKLPSSYAVSSAQYRGSILINPGGPGSSGVDFIALRPWTENFRTIVGDQFDIIGFDPRGVGHSTPPVVILNQMEEVAWDLQWLEIDDLNSTDKSLGYQFAMAQNLGKLANNRINPLAQHVSTAMVARDMLSIMKAQRQQKLQYWGFSYGTTIGATFAAMFPDKVGRIILDGVVDSENYYARLWDNSLRDTDAELNRVYQACVDAGPLLCPFYNSTTSTIDTRLKSLIRKLQVYPIPFYTANTGAYDILNGNDVRKALFMMLFKPYTRGKEFFKALAELEAGDPSLMSQMYDRAGWNQKMECDCPGVPFHPGTVAGAHYAIACGDGDDRQEGVPELQAHIQRMAEFSPFFSVLWSRRTFCSGWKIRPKERFTGSFVVNTSHPILLIGNTADPVTPLWNAHKMSRGFHKSVVLTQNSLGHASPAAASLCTAKYVREYFREGNLPPKGTICEVEGSVFGEDSPTPAQVLSVDDLKILEASKGMHEHFYVPFAL